MNPIFAVHILSEEGKDSARRIAEAFDVLLTTIETECGGSSRELSIAKTKLEEACFYAKKAMASDRAAKGT